MQAQNLSYYDSTALEASAIIKSTPGMLFNLLGHNSHTATVYIQLHDSATVPADTAVPKIVFKAAAQENFFYDFGEIGRWFQNGIVVCCSTTIPTKTVGGATQWFNAQYK